MDEEERPPLTEAEYRAWLEWKLPQMAEQFTALLPQEARDAGMRFEWGESSRPNCLPGCDRLDGHDGRDAGACMRDGAVLTPGPLDLVHRHPDIPVHTPRRRYDVMSAVKDLIEIEMGARLRYSALRPDRYPGVTRPSACTRSEYGFMVHVKPGCRCR